MKRLHIHVAVANIEQSTSFYSGLFGAPPTVQKEDYVKWMLDDPRVNFAISARGREPGLDHLGIQVENEGELKEVSERLKSAKMEIFDEGTSSCCYAQSEKAWVLDPQGIAWETFLSTNELTIYGVDNQISSAAPLHKKSACCAPEMESVHIEKKNNK